MKRNAEPWERTVLLESLNNSWVVSCKGGSQGEKGGLREISMVSPNIPRDP